MVIDTVCRDIFRAIQENKWLRNNRELINVAVSRAKDQLIILSSSRELERLHKRDEPDDLYELVQYVRSNGESQVTPRAKVDIPILAIELDGKEHLR